jgi:hypothetical protein
MITLAGDHTCRLCRLAKYCELAVGAAESFPFGTPPLLAGLLTICTSLRSKREGCTNDWNSSPPTVSRSETWRFHCNHFRGSDLHSRHALLSLRKSNTHVFIPVYPDLPIRTPHWSPPTFLLQFIMPTLTHSIPPLPPLMILHRKIPQRLLYNPHRLRTNILAHAPTPQHHTMPLHLGLSPRPSSPPHLLLLIGGPERQTSITTSCGIST